MKGFCCNLVSTLGYGPMMDGTQTVKVIVEQCNANIPPLLFSGKNPISVLNEEAAGIYRFPCPTQGLYFWCEQFLLTL